jgi:hypothetical protein
MGGRAASARRDIEPFQARRDRRRQPGWSATDY